jgi:3-hydroxybutyryl-CoA dehydrogenase
METIGIVGMGGMGRGIAEVTSAAGFHTVLVKATPGDPQSGKQQLADSFARAVKKGKMTEQARERALSLITFTSDLDKLGSSSLVIESIVETLAPKQALFADLERVVPAKCVLASNTSSLPLGELAGALKDATRFVGLHFFSPVPAMKLVEIGSSTRTYPNAVETAQRFVEALGKTPVMVGDSSGYIVNRLLVPYLLDAISALEARVAPAASIDQAMKLGCGHPMGPLALADAIGLDIVLAMAKTLHQELKDRRYSPPALLRRLVLNGHLGKKTGRGLFDYSVDPARENPELWPAHALEALA